MAAVGQTIENPVAGDSVRFLTLPDGAAGPLVVEMTTQPGGQGPPLHIHPHSIETFEVISGEIAVMEGTRRIVVGAGESHSVAAGIPHSFASHGDVPAVTEVTFDRAGRMAEFLETFYELARIGRVDAEGKPSMPQIALTFMELRDDIRTVVAPWPAQVALFTLLRPVARRRGLRPFYTFGELS